MKKIYKLVLIVLFIIITFIIVSILIHKKQESRPFKKYDFPESLVIENNTDYERIDTIVLVLAYKIFNLDNNTIIINNIPKYFLNKDIEYYGIVQKYSFNNTYIIFVKENMSTSKLKTVLSHEFIHIQQYENGLIMTDEYVIYNGDKIYFDKVEYENRSYEIEAFKKQYKIKKQLNNLLYD